MIEWTVLWPLISIWLLVVIVRTKFIVLGVWHSWVLHITAKLTSLKIPVPLVGTALRKIVSKQWCLGNVKQNTFFTLHPQSKHSTHINSAPIHIQIPLQSPTPSLICAFFFIFLAERCAVKVPGNNVTNPEIHHSIISDIILIQVLATLALWADPL